MDALANNESYIRYVFKKYTLRLDGVLKVLGEFWGRRWVDGESENSESEM